MIKPVVKEELRRISDLFRPRWKVLDCHGHRLFSCFFWTKGGALKARQNMLDSLSKYGL